MDNHTDWRGEQGEGSDAKHRVFIIHGWEADPDCNWFPWVKHELLARGVAVEVPAMPDTMHPNQDAWVAHLDRLVGVPDQHTFFVGHSLGVIAILRYLESLPEDARIGGVILVAGFAEPIGIPELERFVTEPLRSPEITEKISKGAVVFHSDNDPFVPFAQGVKLEQLLNARRIVIPGEAHLNTGSGYYEFPELLVELGSMMDN